MRIIFPRFLKLNNDYYIRELEVGDLRVVNQWHNSTDLYKHLVGTCHYPHLETDAKWIKDGLAKENLYRGLICNDKVPIGVIYLTLESLDIVEFEIFIADESYRGKGIGFLVCSTVIKTIFSVSKYRKITLSVLSNNIRALSLYKKCGFVVMSESKIIKDNETIVIYNMSILKSI